MANRKWTNNDLGHITQNTIDYDEHNKRPNDISLVLKVH